MNFSDKLRVNERCIRIIWFIAVTCAQQVHKDPPVFTHPALRRNLRVIKRAGTTQFMNEENWNIIAGEIPTAQKSVVFAYFIFNHIALASLQKICGEFDDEHQILRIT